MGDDETKLGNCPVCEEPSRRSRFYGPARGTVIGAFLNLSEVLEVERERGRIVDGTYMKVEVPSMCPPRYTVDSDVTVVAPNGLSPKRVGGNVHAVNVTAVAAA